MKITYYGHSCFSVEANGKVLLFDPYILANPKASNIDIDKLKPDVMLISHGHFDHIEDAERIAKNSKALVISNFEIINWLESKGIDNIHRLNIGGARTYDWGTIKMVAATHSSSMPDGTYGGMAAGYVIDFNDEGCFFYSGDTGLQSDYSLIGDYYDLNFAVLPIGGNFTMDMNDAVMSADLLDCDKVIGVHYDTFPPIVINHEEAERVFAEAEKELILLKIGEEKEI